MGHSKIVVNVILVCSCCICNCHAFAVHVGESLKLKPLFSNIRHNDEWNDGFEKPQMERRTLFKQSSNFALLPSLLCAYNAILFPKSAMASTNIEEGNPSAEFIRKKASNIPGYGPPDVLYPSYFVGKWKVTRTIIPTDASTGESQPRTIEYPVRYLMQSDNNVVADRGYNELSLQNVLSSIKPSSSNWEATNPNVLQLTFVDGSSREIKVTKRAFSKEKDENGVELGLFSSEYRRITDVLPAINNIGGIPVIAGDRIKTKWRNNGSEIEGIEVIYADTGVMGDPMSASGPAGGSKLIMKSRIKMERYPDNTNI